MDLPEESAEAALLRHLVMEPEPARLAALTGLERLAALPPVFARGDPEQPALSPLGALTVFLGARALMRWGEGAQAWPWIQRALETYAATHRRGHRPHARHTPLSDALGDHPNLRLVVVEALIAAGLTAEAARAFGDLSRALGFVRHPDWSVGLPADLLAAAEASLGPLVPDEAWLLARRANLSVPGDADERKEATWRVYAEHLAALLEQGRIEEALAFVRAKAVVASRIVDDSGYRFNATCVLAQAGLIDEAVVAARDLIASGHDLRGHLDRGSAGRMSWSAGSGPAAWLAPLDGVPAFERLRARYLKAPAPFVDGLVPGPFKLAQDTVLGGHSCKSCAITHRPLSPGDPILRFRLLHGDPSDAPTIAARDAITGDWARWLRRHRGDGYDFTDLHPPSDPRLGLSLKHPEAARFLFALTEGCTFDIDAFIALVAAPFVRPMRLEWVRGRFDHLPEPQDGPEVNDAAAGDFVSLAWSVLRCGHGAALLERLSLIDPAIADPIMAMLATFERDDCRRAAAAHFGCAELPAVLDLAFGARLSLDDMLRMAEFGRAQPRFAAALAGAFERYNLNIYSNTYPQVNWYLQDLDRYAFGRGCQLVFLLIHEPERVPVLHTMIERRWLVSGVGSGGYDGYWNAGHALFQAAVMNRMLHAPDELPFWLETPWVQHCVRGPTLHEAARHAADFATRRRPPPARS